MEIFLSDPSEIPLPPEEVRIRTLRAEPWVDGKRVRVSVELDPFQKRPSLTLAIHNALGEELAATNILESMARKISITMHLPGERQKGEYTLQARLFYARPAPEGADELERYLQEPLVVDQAQFSFTIPEATEPAVPPE